MPNQTPVLHPGSSPHDPVITPKHMNLAIQAAEAPPSIERFVACINAGVNSWEAAGKILVALRNEDDQIFGRIQKEHPFITLDTLEVFFHIGTRSLYPLAVLLPHSSFKAVREMSYDKQVQICSEPVQIVTRMVGDKPVVVRKPITRMSADECKRSLWRKGNYSVEHQVKQLTTPSIKTIQELLPRKKLPVNIVRVPQVVGRYVVRRAIGGKFCFEETKATPITTQRILLQEGQAVIELTQYAKEQP